MDVKSGLLSPDRRAFLKQAGSLAIMSTLGLAFFTSCSSDKENNPTPGNPTGPGDSNGITVSGSTITIDLERQPVLNNNGGWLLIASAQVLVVNDGGLKALTSVCTHSGCDRSWTFSSNVFTCTCHGSRFDTAGNVLQGPAARPLQNFATTVAGNTLTIRK